MPELPEAENIAGRDADLDLGLFEPAGRGDAGG